MSAATQATGAVRGGSWCVLIVLSLHFVTGPLLRPLVRPYPYSDFATFYTAARCFAENRDPYQLENLHAAGEEAFGGWIGRYFYPPPFAACAVRPLLGLPFEQARRVWVLLEAMAYVVAVALLASHCVTAPRPLRWALGAALALPYAPVGNDLKLGSVSGVLLLFFALFLGAHRRGHANRAAIWLAAAVLLKLTPVLVVAALLLRGERRFVLRVIAAGAVLVAATLPWTGLRPWLDYATRVLPFLATANFSWFTNQSLDAFFWRLLVPNPDTTPWVASPLLQRALAWGTSAVLLAALFRAAWRRRGGDGPGDCTWLASLALVIGLLAARVSWESMLVLALPCFLQWASEVLEGGAGRREAAVAAVAFALCALPFPYSEAPLRVGVGLLLEAPRTYGLVLLATVTLARLERGRMGAAVDVTSGGRGALSA